MSKFLKLFNSHLEYQLYAESNDFVSPNVSRCINLDEVHYTPEPLYLIYEASAKLSEVTSSVSSGLHTNAFTDTNGETLTITSHTFENGVGIIKFNGDVAGIGDYAFRSSSITSIIIPENVTTIGNRAFYLCTGLTSVNIPNSVTTIGHYAFYDCLSLTSVTIGFGVTSLYYDSFGDCYNLTSIIVDNNNTTYDSRNNCNAIIKTSTNELIIGCNNTVIPDSITSIGIRAFNGMTNLTSITIPRNVTRIGNYVFLNCANLTSITSNATTAPTITSLTFQDVKTGGTLYVPSGSTGYDTWMGTGNYYLGKYNWTKIEQ